MKTISTGMQGHLEQECLNLTYCWKLTRRDGVVMAFTNFDRDLAFNDVLYKASTGFTPTSIDSQASLAVDNLDIEGMLSSGSITEADILAGLYDFAEIEAFAINYTDGGHGKIMLRRGWLGEVEIRNKQFVAEIRGLTQKLSQHIGELYSPMCRARFCDMKCKLDIEDYIVTGTVTNTASQSQFSDSSRSEAVGYFNYGNVTFTSGLNNGISAEVKEFRNGDIILALPMPYAIAVGVSYNLQRGCDKTLTSCIGYENAINFRGEPHVPGLDKMLETAGTRSEG